MPTPTGETGYTLLELLVAVAIIALMAMPLSATFGFSINTWHDVRIDVGQRERIILTRKRLGQWIAASYAADPERIEEMAVAPFSGMNSSLSLISPINPDLRADDLYRLSLTHIPERNVIELAVFYDHASEVEAYRGDLLSDVVRAKFSYLDHAGNWLDRWEEVYVRPVAVRLHLEIDGNKYEWPDQVIPLLVDEWSDCVVDSESETQNCISGVHSS
ncbi:PulJ/GspJ family protein [Kordiimonas sp.]|uniref:PulJ/GspJ family protein n=1 Tax=Kordiimonas sp. TaxID=1970157 RepID=UPI003A8F6674